MRPMVRVSAMLPMASEMEVKTMGIITSCSALMKSWPMI